MISKLNYISNRRSTKIFHLTGCCVYITSSNSRLVFAVYCCACYADNGGWNPPTWYADFSMVIISMCKINTCVLPWVQVKKSIPTIFIWRGGVRGSAQNLKNILTVLERHGWFGNSLRYTYLLSIFNSFTTWQLQRRLYF